jgi:H+/Cl- antiporter ClcA/CBS domain-containing protein
MSPSPTQDPDAGRPDESHASPLGDFTTDRRVLFLCLLAAPIGATGALVAKALLWLIAVITNAAYYFRFSSASVTPEGAHLGVWGIAVPVVGALVIGLMARYGSEKIRGHGIPEALEAIVLGRSLMDPKVAVLKPISSAVSIGTGGPFGAEGPIIMTGGAFASVFSRLFSLTASERKTLLVAGAAAGMAAIFSTPVAAVLLAVELLLFEWKPRSLIPVAVSAAIAGFLRVPLIGSGPIFPVPHHAALGGAELATALGVGLAVGFGSGLLTRLVYALEDMFSALPIHWMWWPAIGAVGVGVGGLVDPQVLGVGYDTIHKILLGQMTSGPLALLMVMKAAVWAIALGSGTSGGVLAPLLMVGGAMGTLIGGRLGVGDASLWAMVGMAGMMAGTMRAPLTGMVFMLELTHDVNAVPALMVGSVAALCVTVLLMRRSVLTEKLARRGHHIACEYSVDPFELARVGGVMDPHPPLVGAAVTLSELSGRIARHEPGVSERHAVLVMSDAGELEGILTRGDIVRKLAEGAPGSTPVIDAATRDVAVAYPGETVNDAVSKMIERGVGRLPVVAGTGSRRVVGYLGRAEVLSARVQANEEERVRHAGPPLETSP